MIKRLLAKFQKRRAVPAEVFMDPLVQRIILFSIVCRIARANRCFFSAEEVTKIVNKCIDSYKNPGAKGGT